MNQPAEQKMPVQALFISDLHLQPALPKTTRAFLDFLKNQVKQTEQLYILGDLFEYWAGDDDMDSDYLETIVRSIREAAEKGPCVIVGRCADYVLKDRKDAINIFIYSDIESKTRRAVEEYGIAPDKAAAEVQKNDKYRANHYNYYTERTWGDKANYHLCLNSGFLGIENTVDIIADAVGELRKKI